MTGDMEVHQQSMTTNSVRFHFNDQTELFYKYQVTFSPPIPSERRRSLVLQQFHWILGQYLFDDLRNIIYLQHQIDVRVPQVFKINEKVYRLQGRIPYFEIEHYRVDVDFKRIVAESRPTSKPTRTFLSVLIRRGYELLGMQKIGDGVYDTEVSLECHKIQINQGIRFGTRENEGVPMLWVEPSSLVWRTESLLELLTTFETSEQTGQRNFEHRVISSMIRTPTRTRRFYPVHAVRWELTPLSTFDYYGEQITFVDYYRDHFGLEITTVAQPLLVTRAGLEPKVGQNSLYEVQHPIVTDSSALKWLVHIPELSYTCDILKEAKYNRKLSSDVKPHVNPSPLRILCLLKSFLEELHGSIQVQKLFRNWNVGLDTGYVQVTGDLLPGPSLRLNATTTLDFGASQVAHNFSSVEAQVDFWRLAGSTSLYNVVPLLSWILVCTPEDKEKASRFSEDFASVSASLGLRHVGVRSDCRILAVTRSETETWANAYINGIRRVTKKFQLVMFILPRNNSQGIYASVKNLCTVSLGVASQGVTSRKLTLYKGYTGVVRSIGRQVACKLGGAPWALEASTELQMEPTMTVGLDVYHSRCRKSSSVCAIIFTLNPACTKYFSRTVRQEPGRETCDTLAPIFLEASIQYYKENGVWPLKVVVFRDGVSNRYLNLIKHHEIAQIKLSLDLLPVRPKLIVVLIQKHTTDRLMLLHGEAVLNPMPGTVVNSTITRTGFADFFLFSQLSRGKGPIQPVRCVVLEDDSEDLEFIKKMTYDACFTYYNWPGSIRIPAVCQYAHKAAGFVGNTLKQDPSEDLQNKLYYL